MSKKPTVLISGESWMVHSIHQKGFDSFTTTEYAEGIKWLRAALQENGWEVEYQPAHVAASDFPSSVEELSKYDSVILSDIGANTLLLHPDTFLRSKVLPNRLHAIRDYVGAGGGFVMIGGYLSFQGIDAKAQYQGSAIEDIMPVNLKSYDDRMELPQGVLPTIQNCVHPIVAGLSNEWPKLLGYNQVQMKAEGVLVASVGEDPLIACGEFGNGRSVAFTSDCSPHWVTKEFLEWKGYEKLWHQIVTWSAGRN